MPSVPTVFFLSIYGLTAIAGLMLAFAEGTPFPEILTPALTIIAYVLTERTRKFALPVLWANGLGIAAFSYAVYQMFGEMTTTETRLLAGAHLVVYLTWITLFQAKGLPQYWWMCALSVLQVAIGSILTISSSYGGMLLGFMFASIWTLAIFSLYQAHLQYGQSSEQWESTARSGLASRLAGGLQAVRRPAGNQARTLLLQRSTARSTMQLDPDEQWLVVRFVMSMVAVLFGALVVAAGFFLFIPRLWAGRDEWGANETKQFRSAAITGFTTEVKLGDMVPLLENSRRVLQVSLFNADGLPIDVGRYCANLGYAEPLFRGATMEMYDHGTWTGTGKGPTLDSLPSAPESPSVRQQIVMEPLGTPILFALEPFDAVWLPGKGEQVEWQPVTGQIFRPDGLAPDKTLAYDVYCSQEGIRRRTQTRTNPNDAFATQYFEQYRRVPDSVTRLAALARRLVTEAKRPAKLDKPERARRNVDLLCGYLRDSGLYRYSLDASIRDPKMDPVEDFLFNRKAGHCEYFASALALMLRAVDVPSRLVSGFKGGAINSISGAFEVEQRYAHVWVEAFIEDEPRKGRSASGYWIVVDPTPSSRDASVASFASGIGTAHDLASVVSSTWNRIISIDINSQESSLYVPLQNAIRDWWNPPSGSRPFLALLVAGIVDFVTDPTQWFTATGLLVAASIAVVSAGILWLVRHRRRLWERFLSLWKPQQTERQIRIAFYERFEALCRQLGLVRPRFQTQREFAGTVGPRIREVVQSPDGLPDLPPRLVDFFYRARFGEEQLAPPIVDQLNRDMTALEEALKKSRRHPSTT